MFLEGLAIISWVERSLVAGSSLTILSTKLVDKGQRCVYEEKGGGGIYITLAANYLRLS